MALPISKFRNLKKDLSITDLEHVEECYFDYKLNSLVLDFKKQPRELYILKNKQMDEIESKYNIKIKNTYLLNANISSMCIGHGFPICRLHIIGCVIGHIVTNYNYINVYDTHIRTLKTILKTRICLNVSDSKIINFSLNSTNLRIRTKNSYIEDLTSTKLLNINHLDSHDPKIRIKNIYAYIYRYDCYGSRNLDLSFLESSYNAPNTTYKACIADVPSTYANLNKSVISYIMGLYL